MAGKTPKAPRPSAPTPAPKAYKGQRMEVESHAYDWRSRAGLKRGKDRGY